LADWLVPSAPFTLRCRQQACGSAALQVRHARLSHPLSAPVGTRSPAQHALLGEGWSYRPALFASTHHHGLDLSALCRILHIEARSSRIAKLSTT